MPGHVPGIHVLRGWSAKSGWLGNSGHDEILKVKTSAC
jgi:hypothetical protein